MFHREDFVRPERSLSVPHCTMQEEEYKGNACGNVGNLRGEQREKQLGGIDRSHCDFKENMKQCQLNPLSMCSFRIGNSCWKILLL